MDMIAYVQQTKEDFSSVPFNEVDSLVFCQLVYLKFEDILPVCNLEQMRQRNRVSLRSVGRLPEKDKLFRDERYAVSNRALWEEIVHSPRFGRVAIDYVCAYLDKESETQFAAATFFLTDGSMYVAFRGTDENIVGWKEDFNLAFSKPVPAQKYSVQYLDYAAKRFGRDIRVGGHSKGGNLAVYSAMNCRESIRKRILDIYSMDGPGFREKILGEGHFEEISDRIRKFLPHSSLVGMLFERGTDYEVIESKAIGLNQHDPMTWMIQERAFIKSKGLADSAKLLDTTINDWVDSLDEERTRVFVDTLFDVLYASEADNLIELGAARMKNAGRVMNAVTQLDEETKHAIREVVRAFVELGKEHMRNDMQERLKQTMQAFSVHSKT